ncbi:hypothetical protein PZA11_001766 [Diplocarpon coronariae]|uniref:Heme haloperoxidase family profile domain-containing protein n=1 Tax=Diplocarpon coronariae TaxID=2795749 RepID=A0A218Z515_9HELO|nr:hypothetical protein B2J93_1306 [Marssonina coronariae]
MKSSVITASLAITLTSAYRIPEYTKGYNAYPTSSATSGTAPEGHEWIPGKEGDFRGPCPMMNTLANHGFISRNGDQLTKEVVVNGLSKGLNFDPALATIMWEQAVFVNSEPNATYFTLDQLNPHGVLEHDASLSRSDAYFGNNHVFNQTVFDTAKPYWTEQVLTADMLANSKVYRQLASKASNPEYSFSPTVENFSLGELAAPILVFGDIAAGTTKRDQVIYFIENERLPYEMGFTKQASPVTLNQTMETVQLINKHQQLITGQNTTAPAHKRSLMRDSHFGPLYN